MKNKGTLLTSKIIWYGIISGTVFMTVMLAIALIVKCPTEFQRWVFRICLSIAIAAYASTIPGFLRIKYQNSISAGGAIAVFVIIFILNPELDCKECKIKGIVFVENKIQKHVDVRLLEIRNSAVTDDYGYFEMTVPCTKIIDDSLFSFVFNYLDYIDTTSIIKIKNLEQVIYFKLFKKSLPVKIDQKDILNRIKTSQYIVGRIVDKDGNSLENVIISYKDRECRTNANGYFRLQIPDQSPEQIQFQVKKSNSATITETTAINVFNTFKFN
jgi:hypothetical protein